MHEPDVVQEAKQLRNKVRDQIDATKVLLDNRIKENVDESAHSSNIRSKPAELKPEEEELGNSDKFNVNRLDRDHSIMAEKFDLKTAGSLLPVMNDNEAVTLQLVDAIELYDSLLDENGKKLLTTFVLKTRLSQSAKIRLKSSYTTNDALVLDMKNHLVTKHSAAVLSVQLNTAKQGNKSVEAFGKSIEELMVNLTISQASGDNAVLETFRKANEKIAINAFANGLHNTELRTIIRSKGHTKLNEAILDATEAEPQRKDVNIFHMRGRTNFQRGAFRGRFQKDSRNQNSSRPNSHNNNSFRNHGTSGRSNYRGRNYNNNYRGQWKARNNNNQRIHFMNESSNADNVSATRNPQPSSAFFRAS